MCPESASGHFRGVLCRRCGKPVRLPSLVMKHDPASQGEHDSDDASYHLISRVFILRCRSCEKESIYAVNQIVDCNFASPVPAANHATV